MEKQIVYIVKCGGIQYDEFKALEAAEVVRDNNRRRYHWSTWEIFEREFTEVLIED